MATLFERDYAALLTLGAGATLTRSTEATFVNHDGLVEVVDAAVPRFRKARLCRNNALYSEDFSNALWLKHGGATVVGTQNIVFAAGSLRQVYQLRALVTGDVTLLSITARSNTGTNQLVRLKMNDGNGDHFSSNLTVTPTAQRFCFSYTTATGKAAGNISIASSSTLSAADIIVENLQFENPRNRINQTSPSEYIMTTANVERTYYGTVNANTVDANLVVTEAVGAALPGPNLVTGRKARGN